MILSVLQTKESIKENIEISLLPDNKIFLEESIFNAFYYTIML